MIPVFLACEASDDFGIPYELESDANVRFVEFTLPTSSRVVDSLRTDSENRILVGNYKDDLTGIIAAESYFSMRYFTSNVPEGIFADSFILDSAWITLESRISLQNGSGKQAFTVRPLSEQLPNVVFLSSNQQTSFGNEIAAFEGQIAADTTLISMEVQAAFGQELYSKIKSTSPLIGSTDWPSLAISSTAESESLSQFRLNADTSRLYLQILHPQGREVIVGTDTMNFDTTYLAEFRFDPFTAQFGSSNITIPNPHYVYLDRSVVNANLPDDITTIDVLAGLSTVISTTPYQEFIDEQIADGSTVVFNNASLEFSFETTEPRDTLQNFLSYLLRNDKYFAPAIQTNTFSNLIMNDDSFIRGSNTPSISILNEPKDRLVVNGTLFFQTLFNEYSSENADSNFLIQNGNTLDLVDFLVLSPINITFNRTTFREDAVKLRIYYTIVN